MIILPAIDLQGGEAVRLLQGDYNKKTVYDKDPARLAREFEHMGVQYLHLVDLDGAKHGSTVNLETIKKIRAEINIPIQLGGGIRSAEIVKMYLEEVKINRVILGTVAVKNPGFVSEMIKLYGHERIVVGIDVRNGLVSTSGWTQDSTEHYLELIEKLISDGVKYMVVTDISRDGTLTSPNWDMYNQIKGVNVIVSGGVACDEDIDKAAGYYGVIVGKAFYEGKVDIKKCLSKGLFLQ